MFGALRATFVPAFRSITLILLPVAFIALLTWATAGSSSGNTADPMRAALWFFLIAHQIPLKLSITGMELSASLSFLPIGAIALPILVIRSGFRRVLNSLGDLGRSARRHHLLAFAMNYTIIGTVMALPAMGKTVETPWYVIAPFLLAISLVVAFTVSGIFPKEREHSLWESASRMAMAVTAFLIGIGSLLVAISMIWHFDSIVNLTKVIEPGIFGGLTLLLAQIIYLPNLAVSALSYLAGAGIVINNGSLISPFIHRLDEIPAIPMLGALPNDKYPVLAGVLLINVLSGAFIASYSVKRFPDLRIRRDFTIISILLVGLALLILGRAASGELISANLNAIGPIWWTFPPLVIMELSLGAVIAHLLARRPRAEAN